MAFFQSFQWWELECYILNSYIFLQSYNIQHYLCREHRSDHIPRLYNHQRSKQMGGAELILQPGPSTDGNEADGEDFFDFYRSLFADFHAEFVLVVSFLERKTARKIFKAIFSSSPKGITISWFLSYNCTMRLIGYDDSTQTRWFISYRFQIRTMM